MIGVHCRLQPQATTVSPEWDSTSGYTPAWSADEHIPMNSATQKIVDLLEQSIGLNVDTVSDSTFRQAIQHRMDALRVEDVDSYAQQVATSADELGCLTEEVVVPETWFFRHKESFNILTERILKAQERSRHFLFRILSLPCSTGEEPYSVIMALLQAGINLNHVYIKAVDISERALAIARRGVYGKNSFRSTDLSFRDIFFTPVDKEFVIRESIRAKVHFARGNITDASFTESLGHFDIIFCRNILIYFSPETQQKVIDDLYTMLVPGGILFTGHAEANLFLDSRFLRCSRADSFAFHKKDKEVVVETCPEPGTAHHGMLLPAEPDRILTDLRPQAVQPPPEPSPPPSLPPTENDDDMFETVLLMADTGKLEQAAEACEQHLQNSGPSSRWYYLLGVIRDSLGQPEAAVELLRKALYLDPEHEESLFLLSLLAEQTGEHARAVNYRRRVRKIQQREE
ncbi:MAG TPA: tetratricopeptide repeat protein [Desulfobulbus sp.]|nr:tetratricopeptide repeat protein [Desulfobulbus sp.]